MKKTVSILVMLCCVLMMFSGIAYAADAQTLTMEIGNPMMTVNGVEQEIDPGRGTSPVIIENRTLVPIRAIVEALGGTVAWDESSKSTILTYAADQIQLSIDSTAAYFNDEAYTLDVAPTVINGRTMLPIRFIAEHFQFAVNWNQAEQLIAITKDGQADESPVEPAVEPNQEAAESRSLVVYFSATGNTRSLAERIAAVADADLQEILPVDPYTSEDLNYNNNASRTNQEMNSGVHPAIQSIDVDFTQYDVILLGYPIWWGQCPAPVQTFLDSYDLSGKTIMPFCTSGSSGISGSLSGITQLCPDSNVTAGFRGTAATTEEEISTWLERDGF